MFLLKTVVIGLVASFGSWAVMGWERKRLMSARLYVKLLAAL
jgi:hypothetical protein